MGAAAGCAIIFVSLISLTGLFMLLSEDKKNKFIERVNKF